MTLLSLTARVSCDICGQRFRVEVDPATPCESALGAVEAAMQAGTGSVHAGVMRCALHTAAYDSQFAVTPPGMMIAVAPVNGGWMVITAERGQFFIAQDNPAGAPRHGQDVDGFQAEPRPEPTL